MGPMSCTEAGLLFCLACREPASQGQGQGYKQSTTAERVLPGLEPGSYTAACLAAEGRGTAALGLLQQLCYAVHAVHWQAALVELTPQVELGSALGKSCQYIGCCLAQGHGLGEGLPRNVQSGQMSLTHTGARKDPFCICTEYEYQAGVLSLEATIGMVKTSAVWLLNQKNRGKRQSPNGPLSDVSADPVDGQGQVCWAHVAMAPERGVSEVRLQHPTRGRIMLVNEQELP